MQLTTRIYDEKPPETRWEHNGQKWLLQVFRDAVVFNGRIGSEPTMAITLIYGSMMPDDIVAQSEIVLGSLTAVCGVDLIAAIQLTDDINQDRRQELAFTSTIELITTL